jgi:hypothetical protein
VEAEVENRLLVLLYFANGIGVEFAVNDILDLDAERSVSAEVKSPFDFVKSQLILSVLQIHQRFENVRVGVILRIFY